MKKRMIAMLCALVLLLSNVPMSILAEAVETTEAAESSQFYVGYAKTDLNPWVNPDDHKQGIIPIPLAGYGGGETRLALGIADDDGVYDEQGEDVGIWATCVAVIDDNDNTMLFLSYDFLNANDDIVEEIREKIVADVAADADLQRYSVDYDQIMINASHSHEAPEFTMSLAKLTAAHGTDAGTYLYDQWNAYRTRVIEDMAAMALEALRDVAPTTAVKKYAVDASVATSYQLNGNRNYQQTGYKNANLSGDTKTWYAGDNFGARRSAVGYYNLIDETPQPTYGSVGKYYIGKIEHVTESNDTLYMLEFQFDEGSEKQPVLLTNWRGHATVNSSYLKDGKELLHALEYKAITVDEPDDYATLTFGGYTYTVDYGNINCKNFISGDYVTAFRNLMKNQGYRLSFIQGAGGNINNTSYAYDPAKGTDGGNNSWDRFYNAGNLSVVNVEGKEEAIENDGVAGNGFAKLLVHTAKAAFKEGGTVCSPGQIRNKQVTYAAPQNDHGIDYGDNYNSALIEAWNAAIEKYDNVDDAWDDVQKKKTAMDDAGIWDYYTKKQAYDAALKQFESDYGNRSGTVTFPFSYTHDNGITCSLNSRFHCSNIKLWLWRHTGERGADASAAKLELNTIMLGDNIAFVTAPVELYDYYDYYDENGDTGAGENDWLDLIDDTAYGTPFVMGYANGSHGYLPNTQAYDFNKGRGEEGLGLGSYEANQAEAAKGSGEVVIQKFKAMLDAIKDGAEAPEYEGDCEACGIENVVWKPLTVENAADTYLHSGHYYLAEDIDTPETCTKNIRIGDTVCLDLNGHTFRANDRRAGRAFVLKGEYTTAYGHQGSVLNLFDSVGTGKVIGQGEAVQNVVKGESQTVKYVSMGGGAVCVFNGSTFNLYGGTIARNNVEDPYYAVSTIPGTDVRGLKQYLDVGEGDTVYVHATGKLNVYGGKILDGAMEGDDPTVGSCVFSDDAINNNNTAYITLAADAEVANIYFPHDIAKNAAKLTAGFTVDSSFIGSANLSYAAAVTKDQSIGTATALDSRAELNVASPAGLYVVANDGKLVLTDVEPVAVGATIGGTSYPTAQAAVDAYTGANTVITLVKSDAGTLTIPEDKTVTIDLNGYDLKDVAAEGTLYVKDSNTDNFDTAEGEYGKITGEITGNVKPVYTTVAETQVINGEEITVDVLYAYLQVDEENEGVSFHRVKMDVTGALLNANQVSAYFACDFAGDEKVAGLIKEYGMVISLTAPPSVTEEGKALSGNCARSWFDGDGFAPGSDGNTGSSTRLYNIMKPENGYVVNKVNANTTIYLCTYVLLEDGADGTYVLGKQGATSLRTMLQVVSEKMWNSLNDAQQDTVIDLYRNYTTVFRGWTIDTLRKAYKDREDSTLKVLTLGSSHSQDSMQMLYKVLEENKADGKFLGQFDNVVLARIYYSGCSMNKHKQSIQNNDPVYTYHKNETGTWYEPLGTGELTTMDYALMDEDWDIVVLQEYNVHAGLDRVYNDDRFQVVIDHVNKVCDDPVLAFNMTWANPVTEEVFTEYGDTADAPTARNMPGSRTGDASKTFKDDYVDDYGLDQRVMYNNIVANTDSKVMGVYDEISLLLPAATPVQYANDCLYLNGEEIGDLDLYRDYTHLNDFGRLMVAYLWYAELDRFYNPETASFDREDVSIDTIELALRFSNSSAYKYRYKVTEDWNLTEEEQNVIYAAVKHALENPYTTQANEE